jgi:hypothetical protein
MIWLLAALIKIRPPDFSDAPANDDLEKFVDGAAAWANLVVPTEWPRQRQRRSQFKKCKAKYAPTTADSNTAAAPIEPATISFWRSFLIGLECYATKATIDWNNCVDPVERRRPARPNMRAAAALQLRASSCEAFPTWDIVDGDTSKRNRTAW